MRLLRWIGETAAVIGLCFWTAGLPGPLGTNLSAVVIAAGSALAGFEYRHAKASPTGVREADR